MNNPVLKSEVDPLNDPNSKASKSKQTQARTFDDRRQAGDLARQAMLEKFKARPKADDPEMLRLRAEREAIAKARDARVAERERVKRETAEREEAERIMREIAEIEAREAAALKAEEDAAALIIEQKRQRDARYAARKARR